MDKQTASPAAKLRVAGICSATLELDFESSTLPMLKDELARRSGRSPDSIELISAGKVLRTGLDSTASLASLGLKENCKVFTRVVSIDKGKELNHEAAALVDKEKRREEYEKKMDRIKNAAKALTERNTDGSFLLDDYNLELEDQHGRKVAFGSEADTKAVMMGMMLHTNGRTFIKKKEYKEALSVLGMAEEAFSLCDPKSIEAVSCLTVAGERLAKARKGFERSHGEGLARFRLLHGYQAETAVYLRLELLEGVVSYYIGNREEARKALSSAQAKYLQLQVSDEALSFLMTMGYKESAAKRALKMTGQNMQAAVEFLVEEQDKKRQRREENLRRQAEIYDQMRYGRTPNNKAVDLQGLNMLSTIGFERDLAAEALRINENDEQGAIDLLTDPERNRALQNELELRKEMKLKSRALSEELLSMGYDRSSVLDATQRAQTKEEVLRILDELASGDNKNAHSNQPSHAQEVSSSSSMDNFVGEEVDKDIQTDTRDEEMEDELTRELKGDAIENYNLDVTKEGEAIVEYLAYLDANKTQF